MSNLTLIDMSRKSKYSTVVGIKLGDGSDHVIGVLDQKCGSEYMHLQHQEMQRW